MQTTNPFDSKLKSQLEIGQELTHQGLIWRKLSNGTGVWRYDHRINGIRLKGTLGKEEHGMTLSAARRRLVEAKARAVLETPSKGEQNDSPKNRYFEDIAKSYLKWAKINLHGYRQTEGKLNNHLLPVFSTTLLKDITTAEVERLKTSLIRDSYSPSTIKKVISLLSSIFEHARKVDYDIRNPTAGLSKIKGMRKEITTLSEVEVDNLITSSCHDSKFNTIIGLAAYAGLRASEILGLEWENVNFNKNEIYVCQRVVEGDLEKTTKSGKIRIIPISGKLLLILNKHKLTSGTQSFLIANKDGGHYHHIQKMFSQIKTLSSADFKGGVHILRHTFATTAITKGADIPTVQLWMGHSNINTTMLYVHINSEHSAEQMKLLG